MSPFAKDFVGFLFGFVWVTAFSGCDKIWGGYVVSNDARSAACAEATCDNPLSDGSESVDGYAGDGSASDGSDLSITNPTVVIVGQAGGIWRRDFDKKQWVPENSGTTLDLLAVHGASKNNLAAVGGNTVTRWTGAGWSVSTVTEVPGGSASLRSVFVGGDGQLWAGSAKGYVHWLASNGVWSSRRPTASSLNRSYISTAMGGVFRLDGQTTVWAISNTANCFIEPDGTLCGVKSMVANGVDANLSLVAAITIKTADYPKIRAHGPGRLITAGGEDILLSGSTWTSTFYLAGKKLTSVWESSETNVWAVGPAGLVVHGTGDLTQPSNWVVTTLGTADFYDIYGLSAQNIWAVGSAGTVYHYNGTTWTPEVVDPTRTLHSVFATY